MPKSRNPQGHTTERSATVLLILDLLSDFRFADGRRLLRHAIPAAKRVAALKKRTCAQGIPTIYVNDNLGKWRSERSQLLEYCLGPQSLGRELVAMIAPATDDYFVLKPKHSGFFDTPLQTLLEQMSARRLIVTGVTSHQCILFTAADAYVREYELIIPRDCIAAMQPEQTRAALAIFRTALKADTGLSSRLKLA